MSGLTQPLSMFQMRPKEGRGGGAAAAHRGPRGLHRAEEGRPRRRDPARGRHGM